MGDLSTVPALRAHQHALDCFQKYDVNTLIDCSKDLDWIEEIVTENQKIINFKILVISKLCELDSMKSSEEILLRKY